MSRRVLLTAFTLTFVLGAVSAKAEDKLVYLPQGWTNDERQEYYYTPQGSNLLPYRWFLALEQPYNRELFRTDKHIESFRFNPNPPNKFNPDGLPVGFVKGVGPDKKPWLGMTCAACHTGQIQYKHTSIRVDGGTTLADMIAFSQTLVDALRATAKQEAKFQRFAKRVLGDDSSPQERSSLRADLHQRLEEMAKWVAASRPAHPTGFGNWDAVNILMNTINATAIKAPENNRTPQTPVSYPSIWLSSQVDRLLWNGAVHNLTLRQVGEVIIVFGQASATKTEHGGYQFDSSADLEKLQSIYYTTDKLQPPKWPEEVLGKINRQRAERGARIFAREKCADCHATKPYPMTDKNQWDKQFIKITRTPISDVGTDPNYAVHFVSRTANPGILAPLFKGTSLEGKKTIPGAVLFLATLQQITLAEIERLNPSDEERLELTGYRKMPSLPKTDEKLAELVESLLVYKAGPLDGIWSTAPYLHNGSVPDLYQLLLPPAKRAKTFRLGSREFDPKRVGYRSLKPKQEYLFNTALPGFSNAGHTYGTDITEEERWDLLEFLKTL